MAASSTDRAALFATLCRVNTLYMITRAASGHIGTSFSCMDIVTWLFLNELRRPADIFFSSKGHDVPALYAVLIGLGLLPFDRLHRLRRFGGLPGHPDVSVPLVEANTGSLGMGISKAKGMALANRLLGRNANIYVLTGDGEWQEGQCWEALLSAANRRLDEITVIVDHNKIQSDTWVCRTNDLGSLETKLISFGWGVVRCNGHDFGDLEAALEKSRMSRDRPTVVIADTVKGRGVSFMEPAPEDQLYAYHSGAPDADAYQKAVAELLATANAQFHQLGAPELRVLTAPWPVASPPARTQRLVPAYGRELMRWAEHDPRIVVLDADLVRDCGLLPFKERFPDRFFECGIAEQDMVSQAGGMALKGLLPVVHSFSAFLSSRPNEQIYNNATERTKIIYVGSLAGMLPGGPGHSHQAVRDISTLGAIPGLIMLEPCNEREVELAVEFCFAGTDQSCYLRLVSSPRELPYELVSGYRLQLGRGTTLREGRDAVVFGYGPVLLAEACKAADLLRKRESIHIRVVNLPWLNRVDADWLRAIIDGTRFVVTLDNHYVVGGQGDMVFRSLVEDGMLAGAARVRRLGLTEFPVCGTDEEVLRAHRLDAECLYNELLTGLLEHRD